MKRMRCIFSGGIRFKIFSMLLITIVLIIAAYTAVFFYQTNKVEKLCCYARDETNDEITDGRPYADELSLRLYLPKTFSTDIRGAHVTLATGDPIVDALTFKVEGVPVSYDRAATPGDHSWVVRVVEFLG